MSPELIVALRVPFVVAITATCCVSCLSTGSPATGASPTDPVAPARSSPPGASRYVLPVDAPVVDAFRAPTNRFGPGNRGWEFATEGGEPVRAVADGVVAFAGEVAGRGVVSIVHPDGLRSSVTGLRVVSVTQGESVLRGQDIGVAAPGLHLGFRRNGEYLDPATIYGARRHAYLVPIP